MTDSAVETATETGDVESADTVAESATQTADKSPESPARTDVAVEEGDSPEAPEAYEPFVVPEGVELPTAAVDMATPVFRKLGFDQETAQEMTTLAAQIGTQNMLAGIDEINQRYEQWEQEIRSDSVFGGDKFENSLKEAEKAAVHYFGESIFEELDRFGISSHPAIFRGLARIGAELGDGKIIQPGAGGGGKVLRFHEKIYGEDKD